jgi:hypothetical protein
MKIPYVIDNQTHRLANILNALLTEHKGWSLDVATAYFTVGGFGLLKEGLFGLGNLRLLLGAEPTSSEQLGLRPHPGNITGLIRRDLEALPFDEKTLRLVEDLIAYLRRDTVLVRLHDKGFLHAKCWLFYSDRPGQQLLFDRFRPILAIVGSSNFTAPGLTSNANSTWLTKCCWTRQKSRIVKPRTQFPGLAIPNRVNASRRRTANCSRAKLALAPLSIWKSGTSGNGPTGATSRRS